MVLWSLIVLPKRERQAARAANAQGDDQNDMFGKDRPLPTAASVSPLVSYRALLADFGVQLGKKTRLDANLKRLENHGFIVRKGEDIAEGPLLDLLLDYDALAQRILQGALGDVLAQAKQLAGNLPLALTQPPLEELPTDDELAEDAALLADDAGALDDASAVHADTRPLQSDARPAAGSTAEPLTSADPDEA